MSLYSRHQQMIAARPPLKNSDHLPHERENQNCRRRRGCVGMSLAVLRAQTTRVVALDIDAGYVARVNGGQPIFAAGLTF